MATSAVKRLLLCLTFGLTGCQSSPEWFQNISTNIFSLPGDIMLGGLFPIRQATASMVPRVEPKDIPCDSLDAYGLGRALVMKYAVDEINADQMLLPGIKLGYEILDTCKETANILKPTLLFLTEKATDELAVTCNYTDYEPRVVAVIGPSSSDLVAVVGKLLGFFLMPMISYGATSEQFSNKKLYPSFLRTVPSDKGLAIAMVHLLKEFKWNWVAVVGSEGTYGRHGKQMFSQVAQDMSICVAYEGIIPVYDDPVTGVNTILDQIQANSVRVVVLFSTSKATKIFFKEVIRRNLTGVWIASTAWAVADHVSTIPDIHKVGTIIGFTDNNQPPHLLNSYTLELFTKISEEKKMPGPASASPFRDPCPQCWSLSPANISLVEHRSVQLTAFSVYAAIYSVAMALHAMLGCNTTSCMWGADREIRPWKPESVALMVAGAALLVCQGSVGVLFLKNRGTPLVSASGGVLSGVTLLGLMGGCLSLLLFLGHPGDLVCRLRLPLTSIFHTAALSVILAVSLQIFYVTEFPQKAASHLDTIRGRGGWLIVLVCCSVQTGMCGWYVQTERSFSLHMAKMKINFFNAFLSCPKEQYMGLYLMQGLNLGLSLLSFMCTFMAVKPVRQYNLARDITFSTLIYCVVWVGFIPIYTGLAPRLSSIAHVSFSLGSIIGLAAAYYFPKCHLLLKKPELNSSEHFRAFLEGAPAIPQEETSTPPPQPVSETQLGQN